MHVIIVAMSCFCQYFGSLAHFCAILYGFVFVMAIEGGGVLLFSRCNIIVVAIACAMGTSEG